MEDTIVEKLCNSVKNRIGENPNISDETIKELITSYSNIACVETGYKKLPKYFYEYIVNAVVESYERMGNEGMTNRSELGVNTTYAYKDIEDSLKSKLKGKKNPRMFLGYWS